MPLLWPDAGFRARRGVELAHTAEIERRRADPQRGQPRRLRHREIEVPDHLRARAAKREVHVAVGVIAVTRRVLQGDGDETDFDAGMLLPARVAARAERGEENERGDSVELHDA